MLLILDAMALMIGRLVLIIPVVMVAFSAGMNLPWIEKPIVPLSIREELLQCIRLRFFVIVNMLIRPWLHVISVPILFLLAVPYEHMTGLVLDTLAIAVSLPVNIVGLPSAVVHSTLVTAPFRVPAIDIAMCLACAFLVHACAIAVPVGVPDFVLLYTRLIPCCSAGPLCTMDMCWDPYALGPRLSRLRVSIVTVVRLVVALL